MAAKLYATAVLVAVCATTVGLAAAFPYGDDVEAPQPSYEHHHQYVQAAEHEHEHGDGDDQQQQQQQQQQHAARSYHFQYAVHDPITGDVKSQNEVSDGRGTVKGTYSLLEADGSTRVVEYTADDEHGFRADVKKIQPQHKPAAATPAADAEPEYKFDYPEEHQRQQHVHYYPGETFTPTH